MSKKELIDKREYADPMNDPKLREKEKLRLLKKIAGE